MRSIELIGICACFITGLYGVFFSKNLIKKLLMLGILNAATIGFFLYIGSARSKIPPILNAVNPLFLAENYADPLPQALVLTAVVIGFATQSLSLVYVMFLSKKYHTIEEDKIEKLVEEERKHELDA
ncbi:MAG TPA: cation:proton antiporter subunit C [Thermotogota bacterium]|nr:cation:proton antiporter subunit C [Thermotogota bacterium]HPJ87677.1 cation:proton antiporter subunit C [Thermotogota bacterium]HPR94884.1 cation:proton antiporter subunit C [Thermotogota bacterium]